MNKQKVFKGLMELVSDVGWSGFTLAALARNQEIEESELEKLFSDKIGLLQAFSEFIDEQTLANLDPDIFDPGISMRERLLEIMLLDLLPFPACFQVTVIHRHLVYFCMF